MRKFTKLLGREEKSSGATSLLVLPFELRRKSRQVVRLETSEEVGLLLPPGTVLQTGDILESDDGSTIRIEATNEELMVVTAEDPFLLLRAAYHLGNRHTAVQIEPDRLLLALDPVLKEMLIGLGAKVAATREPFTPELGAYGGGHIHGHDETFAEDQALAHRLFHEHAGD
ncbi:MAG TPA: urease accessory protein UreE [Chthoniobacterales bacterium]|nr:urease accessory protein UreE [Chthoniobacterales bacterium]